MCIGIIWNHSFLVGGCARAEARIDPRPLRTSRSTAHGAQVVWPLDYMGRAPQKQKPKQSPTFLILSLTFNSLILVRGSCLAQTDEQTLSISPESPSLSASLATRQHRSSPLTPKFLNADDIWAQNTRTNALMQRPGSGRSGGGLAHW